MFRYSCSRSRLANWVLCQMGLQPDVLFPIKKGWKLHFKVICPGNQESTFFLLVVVNQTECLAFVPLDDSVEKHQIKQIRSMNLKKTVHNEFDFSMDSFQLIFMANEKCKDYVLQTLEETFEKSYLMVLDSEKMTFVLGTFINPRLEYRHTLQALDTDMISDFLPANLPMINEGMTKTGFYLNIFHRINGCWLSGEKQVLLRQILKGSIPYWKYYKKIEQQNILKQIREELEIVFNQFFSNSFYILDYSKKPSSLPETFVFLPEPPKSKKSMSRWLRMQSRALNWLRDNVEQISIDDLELEA